MGLLTTRDGKSLVTALVLGGWTRSSWQTMGGVSGCHSLVRLESFRSSPARTLWLDGPGYLSSATHPQLTATRSVFDNCSPLSSSSRHHSPPPPPLQHLHPPPLFRH